MPSPNYILDAVRAGLLYECFPPREIAAVNAQAAPQIVEPVQRFRGSIYGDIPAVENGLHIHAADSRSHHVLLVESGSLIGCARYDRAHGPHPVLARPIVELGGFTVLPAVRGGRATLLIINKTKQLGAHFGDTSFLARASVQLGSASILKKLGGQLVGRYFDEEHRRDVEILSFEL